MLRKTLIFDFQIIFGRGGFMRRGKKERVTFASECTSMLMTKSCCIDCQGAVLRPEDLLRTLRFFCGFFVVRLFTASYSKVFYPGTINFDVPSQILQANIFWRPLISIGAHIQGGHGPLPPAPLPPLPPRHCFFVKKLRQIRSRAGAELLAWL